MDTILSLKDAIITTSLAAYNAKLFVGTSGNLSVRVPGKEEMLITPTSVRYDTMRREDIVHMGLDGTILDGTRPPSSEWRMHAAVLRHCPEANAVFHTHSPYATAFATVRKDVPNILIEMGPFLGGGLPCAPFAMPGTEELGMTAVGVFQTGLYACLLGSPGVLTIGKDIDQAYIRAEYAEEAAMIYHHALQAGEPVVLAE